MTKAINDQAKQASHDRETVEGKFSDTRASLKGLRRYVKEVDVYLPSRLPQSGGASVPGVSSQRQSPVVTEGGASPLVRQPQPQL